jgi:hypothetical protein
MYHTCIRIPALAAACLLSLLAISTLQSILGWFLSTENNAAFLNLPNAFIQDEVGSIYCESFTYLAISRLS